MAGKKSTGKANAGPGGAQQDSGTASGTDAGTQGPSVPVLVPSVRVRHLPVPRMGVGHVAVPKVSLPIPDQVRNRFPDPVDNRLLWYGGLAGLAAVGVIGWPVAGVVAAGAYVAEHRARHWLAGHEDGGDGERSGAGAGQVNTPTRGH